MWKEVIICLTLCMLCFVIGFGSGFSLGVEQTVKEVTIMAQRFVTFEINETLIEEITSEEFNLSEETVAVLMKEFGTTTVKSNVKKYRDKFLVELTIGPFLLNHYYPASLSNEELKIEIEKDKNVWLNDLAREFSREEVVFEEVTI